MKIIDLGMYRTRRVIENLEKRIGELASTPTIGAVRQMKICFKEWLKINAR
jgi:hypothetical protein